MTYERENAVSDIKKYAELVRDAFEHETNRLEMEGQGQLAHDIMQLVRELTDEQLARLGAIIRNT